MGIIIQTVPMSKCERCGVFYEEAESPSLLLCAICAEKAAAEKADKAPVQSELF